MDFHLSSLQWPTTSVNLNNDWTLTSRVEVIMVKPAEGSYRMSASQLYLLDVLETQWQSFYHLKLISNLQAVKASSMK